MYDLVTAIREMRTRLGDSQQKFANRLGRSLRAIANYESGRQPTTEVLIQLAQLATQNKMEDLARVFSAACSEELTRRTTPMNEEEEAWTRAILTLSRNKHALPDWADVKIRIVSALESLVTNAVINESVRTDPHEVEKTLALARSHAAPPSAEQKLEDLARRRSAETGDTFEKSYSQVLLDNPELYTEYLQERADAARGLSFESSLAVYGTRQHEQRQRKQARPAKKAKR